MIGVIKRRRPNTPSLLHLPTGPRLVPLATSSSGPSPYSWWRRGRRTMALRSRSPDRPTFTSPSCSRSWALWSASWPGYADRGGWSVGQQHLPLWSWWWPSGWRRLYQARHRTAQQAWQQDVQRQRKSNQLASEQLGVAYVKQREALRVWMKTSQKLLADGTLGFRPDPDATRKLQDAKDEVNRALERWHAEKSAPPSA